MDNLISLDGIHTLEIKTKTLIVGSGIQQIKFDTPFKNRCVFIIPVDYAASGDSLVVIGIIDNKITKYGFSVVSSGNPQTFGYIAFGY